jgi:peroxiredoxin
VLHPKGHTQRATFIVDKHGMIQYIKLHDIDKQPDNQILLDKLRDLEPPTRTRRRRR